MKATFGNRYCLYHAPNPALACRGALLHVHSFGDELNRVRRMTALQARILADMGFGVLQIDLFGCGDSAGDFRDARWQIWKDDLAVAKKWLDEHAHAPVNLWGVRLGALLAMDFASTAQSQIDRLILWQPVTNGETFMTQFLRLRLANQMLTDSTGTHNGTSVLRSALLGGEALEVAGYEIAPELAAAIDALDVSKLNGANQPIHWLEVVPEAGRAMPPARERVSAALLKQGADLRVHVVAGPAFWATQEPTECEALLSATAAILGKGQA